MKTRSRIHGGMDQHLSQRGQPCFCQTCFWTPTPGREPKSRLWLVEETTFGPQHKVGRESQSSVGRTKRIAARTKLAPRLLRATLHRCGVHQRGAAALLSGILHHLRAEGARSLDWENVGLGLRFLRLGTLLQNGLCIVNYLLFSAEVDITPSTRRIWSTGGGVSDLGQFAVRPRRLDTVSNSAKRFLNFLCRLIFPMTKRRFF